VRISRARGTQQQAATGRNITHTRTHARTHGCAPEHQRSEVAVGGARSHSGGWHTVALVHAVRPCCSARLPPGQGRQGVALSLSTSAVPAAHRNCEQGPDEPAGVCVPAPQGLQGVAGFKSWSVVPARHVCSAHTGVSVRFVAEPGAAYVPLGQAKQGSEESALAPAKPAGQAKEEQGPVRPLRSTEKPRPHTRQAVAGFSSSSVEPIAHTKVLHGPLDASGVN
jgi:hypothetical protein